MIEEQLERIANALEILAGSAPPVPHDVEERPKATRKRAAKKKGAAKKKPVEEPTEPDPALTNPHPTEPDDTPLAVTREDVQKALVTFCKEGPGQKVAKEVLDEFKAGSISTLEASDYSAFVERLDVVALASA